MERSKSMQNLALRSDLHWVVSIHPRYGEIAKPEKGNILNRCSLRLYKCSKGQKSSHNILSVTLVRPPLSFWKELTLKVKPNTMVDPHNPIKRCKCCLHSEVAMTRFPTSSRHAIWKGVNSTHVHLRWFFTLCPFDGVMAVQIGIAYCPSINLFVICSPQKGIQSGVVCHVFSIMS